MGSVKHHYNPRYYLKRFENPDGALWRWDVETKTMVRGSGDHLGLQKHWNRLENPPEGYAIDWAETRLAEIDGFASQFLHKLLDGKFPRDLRALACAISFMENHQPRLRREVEQQNDEAWSRHSNDMKLIISLTAALRHAPDYVPLTYMILDAGETQPQRRFLTASNPLVSFDNKMDRFFPISSRYCLFLIHQPDLAAATPKFTPCGDETLAGINGLILKSSWHYIYSCRPDFEPL
jgi:hypothetical protein